jgi:hypothetical protein
LITHLELLAEVDDQGIGHGLNVDPVAIVGELEAGDDHAREEQGDEVPVAVRRQAERRARVGARRVVVDAVDQVAAADVALEVSGAKPHAVAQEAQQLHPCASRRRRELLDELPEPRGLARASLRAVADGEGAGEVEAVPPVLDAAGVVGAAGEEPVGPAAVLRVEVCLVRRRQPEELLAHGLHVADRQIRDAVVDHLQCLPLYILVLARMLVAINM